MPYLRRFAATKTIVGMDIVEYNPLYDNRGQQTARLVRRTMLSLLTGVAMKKQGMDPNYIHPRVEGRPWNNCFSIREGLFGVTNNLRVRHQN